MINPLAAIAAGQMMLEQLGEEQAAAAVEAAIMKVVANDLKSLAAGKMGYTTTEVGTWSPVILGGPGLVGIGRAEPGWRYN